MTTRDDVYDSKKCEEVTTFLSSEIKPKEASLVGKYYDLVTDFYEAGWGKCFHYAPQGKGQTYKEAIIKHELDLAKALNLKPGMKVLDAGCGIAGPMVNIAKATGSDITGITICNYQISKGQKYIEKSGLTDQCNVVHGDFMKTEFTDNSFDAIYAIETTCHAPDRVACFKEMHRILKPGSFFGGYEWCVKPGFDRNNPDHRKTIEMIEHSTQTQKTATFEEIQKSLKDAGFEVLEAKDLCTPDRSWCAPLYKKFRRKKIIIKLTGFALSIAEKIKMVPKGTCKVSAYLEEGAAAFVEAEKLDIFTPNYYFLAKKPN